MSSISGIVKPSARLVAEAVQRVVADFVAGRIQEEPDFTSRMLQAIQAQLDGTRVGRIQWQSLVTTSHGPHPQEKATGADFMGVLSINLPFYSVRKGFLAQAKRGDSLGMSEMTRLKDQCDAMLKLTPEAYVFLYKGSGVRITPAIAVLSARVRRLTELHNLSVQRFFELHLESFVGDRRLSTVSADQLEALMEEYDVNHILYLGAQHHRVGHHTGTVKEEV